MKGLKRIASMILPTGDVERIWKRMEIIGDILVIKKPFNYPIEKLRILGSKILEMHPYIKAVYCQTSPVTGDYRLRKLEWLAGEKRTETIYVEHGCKFKVDIAKTYISPALNYEHIRVARQVGRGEIVVNMFAGVGLFSIIIAKHANPDKVYSIDINPVAYNYMLENTVLNKVNGIVIPILGDSKSVVEEKLVGVADRVLMPLPNLAYEYIETAVKSIRERGVIHVYEFTKSLRKEDSISRVYRKFHEKLCKLGINNKLLRGRIVRSVGPRKYQVVLDILIEKPNQTMSHNGF